MLRVSEIKSSSSKVIFQLEGKITSTWVNELIKECNNVLTTKREIILDLASVSYIDEQGIYALKSLQKEKVKLINCSLFLSLLLTELVDN
ncbi:MAG: STAS domain-containing protein [Acidobacteria bacterium]|nr:STAS domain-containing protein [Acidobacteriota bacterium]